MKVSITTNSGRKVRVTCFAKVGHFALTHTVNADGKTAMRIRGRHAWTVTHVLTGASVCAHIRRREDARRLATRLEVCGDSWEFSTVPRDDKVRKMKAADIIRAFQASDAVYVVCISVPR